MRTLQIAIIGSGSSYTPELINGFIERGKLLNIGRFIFCDIDHRRNQVLADLSRRMLAKAGVSAEIVTTDSMEEAVTGSDYVLAQIRVGGMAARIRDEKIPLRYGLLGQETTGIGGMMCAFRTIPVMRELTQIVKKRSPEAWIINFSNPSGLVAEALSGEPGVKLIGLCNAPINMITQAKALLGAGDDFDYDYIGLNHLAWLTGAYAGGQEMLQELLAAPMEQSVLKNIPDMEYPPEMLQAIGGFPVSYLSYYYFRDEMFQKCLRAEQTRGEECLALEKKLLELYENEALAEAPAELGQRGGSQYSEAAVNLLEAIENDRGTIQVVNVPNRGAVPFLQPGDVAEIRCRITKDGPVPLELRKDPGGHIKGLMQAVKAYEKLAARAALTGSYIDAVSALLTNPLTQDYAGAAPALNEMLAANREYLPQFSAYLGKEWS